MNGRSEAAIAPLGHLGGTIARGLVLSAIALLMAAIAALFVAKDASAARSEAFVDQAVTARLLTAENGVAPGAGTLSAGLDLELGEGWKTYWRSPGEVGLPPSVDWTGSENVADVAFLWPAPERFTAFGIENFGYHDEVVFPLRVTLAEPGEPVRLKAQVSILTCSEICVPQTFALDLSLPAGTGIDSDAAGRITMFADKVPDEGPSAGITVEAAHLSEDLTALTLTARSDTAFRSPDVFPELGIETAFGKPDIRLAEGGRLLWARLPVLAAADTLPDLSVTITDGSRAVTLTPQLAEAAPAPPFAVGRAGPGFYELMGIALVALLGGLILNVMPCVLPVLSIKLSSVISSRGQDRGRVRAGFLTSGLGVLAFMWLLAGATLGVQSVGLSVGWGLQFQNPVFLALMFMLLALFSANLFGAFDISLPSSLQTRLARGSGVASYAGDFATGAFAAVLATPCSAPFLGTAVAFALSGRPVDILVVFTALGVGLALPYFAIALFPGLVAFLPRPGRWMGWIKALLGALLALTAAWLIWVLSGVGGGFAALAVTASTAVLLLLLSVRRIPGPAKWTAAAAAAALPLLAAGFLADSGPVGRTAAAGTDWVPFDRAEIARQVSRGKIVFVDVTADWCLTCKANKALVLERDPVAAALAAPGVIPMQADWTRPDERISRYLESFNRFGIPFNAVYGPAAPEGIVLSEILSAASVLEALEQAKRQGLVGR